MLDLDAITAIEERYTRHWEHTLGEAFGALRERWENGARDDETALRLLFLAWYSCAEPPGLTGLACESASDLTSELWTHFGGAQSGSSEFLLSMAVYIEVAPYCLGPEALWTSRGRGLRERAHELRPSGHDPALFEGRGAFGHYMAHMLRVGAA